MKVHFYLRFKTRFGQTLWVTGNADVLGNCNAGNALPMVYLNDEFWEAEIKIKKNEEGKKICYQYFLKNEDGEIINEWGIDRCLDSRKKELQELDVFDTWNHAGEYENAFYSTAFADVLLKHTAYKKKDGQDKHFTHIFKIKAPLLSADEAVCLLGNGEKLGNWKEDKIVLLEKKDNWWMGKISLSDESHAIAYKYAVYNTAAQKLVRYEDGDNRLLHITGDAKKKITLLHDGFIRLPNNTWKGAGVAIPVFSLRSHNSFGVGEFADIKLLADWANETGLKLIQLLPVNDTIASFTCQDSYPYSAVSAFALHPLYINLAAIAGENNIAVVNKLYSRQKGLNELEAVDYEEVMNIKLAALNELYNEAGEGCRRKRSLKPFIKKINIGWMLMQPFVFTGILTKHLSLKNGKQMLFMIRRKQKNFAPENQHHILKLVSTFLCNIICTCS